MNPDEFRHNAFHGTFGLLAGAIGAVTSFLPQIEQWLRILVLLASLVATCLSVWKLLKGKRSTKTGSSLPTWTFLLAVVLCFVCVAMAGCSPAPSAKPTTVQVSEVTEQVTSVRGSDGRVYRLVKRGVDAGPGKVSTVDEWQPVGEGGIGKPVYARRLQATWDGSDPIFIKVGVLE
jgi:hypothetical protein